MRGRLVDVPRFESKFISTSTTGSIQERKEIFIHSLSQMGYTIKFFGYNIKSRQRDRD